jgi:hypothetical protein
MLKYYKGGDKKKFNGKIYTFNGYVMGTLGVKRTKENLSSKGYLVRSQEHGLKNYYAIWKRKDK